MNFQETNFKNYKGFEKTMTDGRIDRQNKSLSKLLLSAMTKFSMVKIKECNRKYCLPLNLQFVKHFIAQLKVGFVVVETINFRGNFDLIRCSVCLSVLFRPHPQAGQAPSSLRSTINFYFPKRMSEFLFQDLI